MSRKRVEAGGGRHLPFMDQKYRASRFLEQTVNSHNMAACGPCLSAIGPTVLKIAIYYVSRIRVSSCKLVSQPCSGLLANLPLLEPLVIIPGRVAALTNDRFPGIYSHTVPPSLQLAPTVLPTIVFMEFRY